METNQVKTEGYQKHNVPWLPRRDFLAKKRSCSRRAIATKKGKSELYSYKGKQKCQKRERGRPTQHQKKKKICLTKKKHRKKCQRLIACIEKEANLKRNKLKRIEKRVDNQKFCGARFLRLASTFLDHQRSKKSNQLGWERNCREVREKKLKDSRRTSRRYRNSKANPEPK